MRDAALKGGKRCGQGTFMDKLEKRMRDLEELIFRVVLQTKAETLAVRDILLEKDLVSPERWDELVRNHKNSYSLFEVVKKIEKGRTAKSLGESPDSGNRDHEE